MSFGQVTVNILAELLQSKPLVNRLAEVCHIFSISVVLLSNASVLIRYVNHKNT